MKPSGETAGNGITLWQIQFEVQQKTSSEEEVFANLIARDGTFTRPRFSLGKFLENV
jgi:hypothetical protein